MSFIDKQISARRAIGILAKKGIEVNENEASIILDFLYLMAKTYNKDNDRQNVKNLKEKSNLEKTLLKPSFAHFLDQNK